MPRDEPVRNRLTGPLSALYVGRRMNPKLYPSAWRTDKGLYVATLISLLQQAVERLSSIPVRSAATRNMVFLGEAYLIGGDITRAARTAREALAMSQADTALSSTSAWPSARSGASRSPSTTSPKPGTISSERWTP